MTFDYLERVVVDGQLEVDDIGQCAILGRNDLGEEWYLFIKTELGWTEIIEWGPVIPDFDLLPATVNISYNRIEWSSYKIEKTIDKFLNNPKRGITQAQLTDVNEVRHLLITPIDKVFPPEIEDNDELEEDELTNEEQGDNS